METKRYYRTIKHIFRGQLEVPNNIIVCIERVNPNGPYWWMSWKGHHVQMSSFEYNEILKYLKRIHNTELCEALYD